MRRRDSHLSWLLPPLAIAGGCAALLAFVLMAQGLRAGTQESILLAWLFVFVPGLPLLLAVLAAAARVHRRWRLRRVIPNAGKTIPGTGQ